MARIRALLPWAAIGALAAIAGMATGHLVAAALSPSASPVLAVGATVIDATPTPMKEWAVREFGTADKPILIGSVVVVVLLAAALAGILARRRPGVSAALLGLLVSLAVAAALTRPEAGVDALLPGLATLVAGLGILWWLGSRLCITERAPSESPGASTTEQPSRRGVLLLAGAVAVLAGVMGWAGQRIIDIRTQIPNLTLPRAKSTARPLPTGLETRYDGISKLRTPAKDFYRIDTRLSLPVIDFDNWELTIDGDVDVSYSLDWYELSKMNLIERDITLNCVSNQVGGPYISSGRWLGVPLADLLDKAGVGGKADQILSTDVEGFTISTPLEAALDGRDTMIAIGLNGEPLSRERGFPARLLTPGLYGFVGATKWLRRLTLTTYDADSAYWTDRKWATDAPVKISSRLDTPKAFSDTKAGTIVLGGVAWAQRRGIGKVEVRIDGGAWQEAKLGPDVGLDYWRQWYLPWKAESGSHRIAVRATTRNGEVQTGVRAQPFPNGASGIQEVTVNVG